MTSHNHLRAGLACFCLALLAACAGKGGAGSGVLPHALHSQSFSTAGVPTHVMTAIYGDGVGGTIPTPNPAVAPVATQAQYLSWAYTGTSGGTNWISAYNGAGVSTIGYAQYWRNYSNDYPNTWYTDLAPGGAHAAAEAKNCSGTPTTASNPTQYLNDPRATPSPGTSLGHANFVIQSLSPNYTAYFADNTAVIGGMSPQPCNYEYNGNWIPATNTVDSQITKSGGGTAQLFLNTITGWWVDNDGTDGYTDSTKLSAPSNVLGLECENCYLDKTISPVKVGISNGHWDEREDAEIDMVAGTNSGGTPKIFWSYNNGDCSASNSATGYDERLYVLASFLLTYDPGSAMLQECFTTPSNFEVYPETQLVPEMPQSTASASTGVSGYLVSGTSSLYARKYADCYYQGSLIGQCEILVNPATSGSVTLPSSVTSGFTSQLVLCGQGVLDGGSVVTSGTPPSGCSTTTTQVPSSLGALEGIVLIGPTASTSPVSETGSWKNSGLSANPSVTVSPTAGKLEVMTVFGYSTGGCPTLTVPTGWTLASGSACGNGRNEIWVLTHTAKSGETSYGATLSPSTYWDVIVTQWSGANTSAPFSVAPVFGNPAGSTTVSAPAISGVGADDMMVSQWSDAYQGAENSSTSPTAGWVGVWADKQGTACTYVCSTLAYKAGSNSAPSVSYASAPASIQTVSFALAAGSAPPITLNNKWTAEQRSATPSVNVTPTAGMLEVMTLFAYNTGGCPTLTVPSGWTLEPGSSCGNSRNEIWTLWHVAQSGEGTYAATLSTTAYWNIMVTEWANAATSSPFDVAPVYANPTPSTSVSAPTITTATNGDMLISQWSDAYYGSAGLTPSTWTAIDVDSTGGSACTWVCSALGYNLQSSAGSNGPPSTSYGTNTPGSVQTMSAALRP